MSYMIEGGGSTTQSKAKAWLYKYPEESHELLKILTNVIIDYLVEQICAGAQVKCGYQIDIAEIYYQYKTDYIQLFLEELRYISNISYRAVN
jgi:uroporphyrinogen-III decarboxylase